MEIKGVYNEKTYKKEKDKEYGPDKYFTIVSKTAGQFLQEAKEEKVPYYAFRPRKTPDEVKEEFLRGLKAKASVDFYNSAVKTIKVIRQYFPVNYIDVHSVEESQLTSTTHYKPSGEYTIDGKLEGDTLKVDVSQGSTYSHTTYEREMVAKTVNQKKYYDDLSGPLHRFSKKLFETNEVDESALMPAEELMKDAMFSYTSPRYILGRNASYNLLQVLLFPIWRVECKFDGHTYVNYVSDVAPSEIVYLELSQEEQTRIIEEKRKKEFEDAHGMGTSIFSAISCFIHLLTLGVALDGLGYCGFFVAHLGKTFGIILNLLGGFGLISTIFLTMGYSRDNLKEKKIFFIISYVITGIDLLIYIISVFMHI